jgi:CubicO group peptidase (beta-lactamase class C family)
MPDSFEKVREILAAGVGSVFSGAVLGCWRNGQQAFLGSAGTTAFHDVTALPGHPVVVASVQPDTVFDLASLTKPLATLPVLLSLGASGHLDLDGSIGARLPVVRGTSWETVTTIQLLAHVSGMPAWYPFAAELLAAQGEIVAGTTQARDWVLSRIASLPAASNPGSVCTYSDPGFILLAALAEAAGGTTLDRLFAQRVALPLGLRQTFFVRHVSGQAEVAPVPQSRIAATEICPTRRRCLQGEVHDDNAWVLGGVSGHAGLFSTAGEVARICLALRDAWLGDQRFLLPALARRALSCEATPPGSTRRIGLDTPSPHGSMAGDLAPTGTVGHLGFTGTSLWMDPGTGNLVVLLTNRVHPERARIGIQAFRPLLHDACWQALNDAVR